MVWMLCCWLAMARADDLRAAEHVRLSAEIQQLAGRQVWVGVERKYEDLEALGVELTFEDLLYGAYAARALGDTEAAYDRLRRAARLRSSREVVDWLSSIDANYGHVELVCTPVRLAALESAELMLDPEQRKAFEVAVASIQKTGAFSGLLPKGSYTFSGTSFKVEPGLGVRIEVSPKLKKTNGIIVQTHPLGSAPVLAPAPSPEPEPLPPEPPSDLSPEMIEPL